MIAATETLRLDALKKLAAERFGTITPSEEAVLRLSASTTTLPPSPSNERPELRSEFLRWLTTDKDTAAHVDPLGLRAANATLSSPLNLDYCKLPFPLLFTNCAFRRSLRFNAADLPALSLDRCALEEGISADALHISGNLFLQQVESNGALSFVNANIGGNFNCAGTHLNAQGTALNLDGGILKGDFVLQKGFSATGVVQLTGAQIGGSVQCEDCILKTPDISLNLDSTMIKGNVLLLNNFQAYGTVRLRGAQIEGDHLQCMHARIGTLYCRNMRLDGNLIWAGIKNPSVKLYLSGASVKSVEDERESWPAPGNLRLDGFVYQELNLHKGVDPNGTQTRTLGSRIDLDPNDRIDWLKRQQPEDQTSPQPWLQLAKVLDAKGDPAGAKKVLYAFSRVQARNSSFVPRNLSLVYDWVEEDPLKVMWPILLLWLFGSLIFWRARRMRAMAPTEKGAYQQFVESGEIPSNYVPFSPVVYTLETVLPVVKFGQEGAWAPNPQSKPASWFPGRPDLAWTRWLPGSNFPYLEFVRRLLIVIGWGLALILVGAIGSRFKS